jgi:uncharacterized membrane protein
MAAAVQNTSGNVSELEVPPLREYLAHARLHDAKAHRDKSGANRRQNVGQAERVLSAAAGAVLAAMGLARKDGPGLLIAGLGGSLLYRGASGHCHAYSALGINTAKAAVWPDRRREDVQVAVSYLINKPADQLYAFWHDFEQLPKFMTHVKSVQKVDARRSHWVATAPWLYGGEVEWDAEIVEDELNRRIVWQSLPDADVQHRGSIEFVPALGDRGTNVRVRLSYAPPAGQIGRWTAKLLGEEPEQQVREDLRNFKRLMEVGEIPTIQGQPRGKCR